MRGKEAQAKRRLGGDVLGADQRAVTVDHTRPVVAAVEAVAAVHHLAVAVTAVGLEVEEGETKGEEATALGVHHLGVLLLLDRRVKNVEDTRSRLKKTWVLFCLRGDSNKHKFCHTNEVWGSILYN